MCIRSLFIWMISLFNHCRSSGRAEDCVYGGLCVQMKRIIIRMKRDVIHMERDVCVMSERETHIYEKKHTHGLFTRVGNE